MASKVTVVRNGVPYTSTTTARANALASKDSGSKGGSSAPTTSGTPSGFVNGRDTIRSDRDNATRAANNIRPATDDEPTFDENAPTGVDTSQPSPKSVDAQPFTNPKDQGVVPYEQAQQSLATGGLTGSALQGAQQALANKYQVGFQQAQQQMGAGAVPQDGGAAKGIVSNYVAPDVDSTTVDQVFSEDPVINNIMQGITQLMSPDTLKGSLMSDYKALYKESGLKDINEELIDAQTILDGTEDDIRNEIQTAGGFGTESQVQAMTLSRNKGLLKRYNQLFAAKQSAEQQLNTMMNLSAQDRQMAQQRVTNQISTMFQFAQFRQQSINAVKETARFNLQTFGADAVYDMYKTDPTQLARYEAITGMPSGGLAVAASKARQEKSANEYLKSLQVRGAELDIQKKERELGIGVPQDTTAVSQTQDRINEINKLVSNVTAVGPNPLARFDPLNAITGKQEEFLGAVEQIRSQLSLDSLINAKAQGATFGALSEGELALLQNSGSKLSSWAVTDTNGKVTGYKVSENAFKKEMDKINNYAKIDFLRKGGDPDSVGVIQLPGGSYATRNSDGTVTEFSL